MSKVRSVLNLQKLRWVSGGSLDHFICLFSQYDFSKSWEFAKALVEILMLFRIDCVFVK